MMTAYQVDHQECIGPIYIYHRNSNSARAAGFKPTSEVYTAFVYLALEELGKVI